jgi:hypothetical protein
MLFYLKGLSNQEVMLWACPGFRDQGFPFALFQHYGYFAVGVVQVAKIHAFGRANTDTGRLQPLFDPVVKAESTFVHMSVGMRKAGIVWA